MLKEVIIPIIVLCVTIGLMFSLILQGEVLDGIKDFKAWSKAKFGAIEWRRIGRKAWIKVRGARRLLNAPFQQWYHERTCSMPFALGQVWAGRKTTWLIVGRTADQRWVVEVSSTITKTPLKILLSSEELRENIYKDEIYLYDWNQELSYSPKKVSISGVTAVILEREA